MEEIMTCKQFHGKKRLFWMATALGIAMLANACQKTPDKNAEKVEHKMIPGAEVIMKADGHTMTLDDYHQCIDLHKLQGRQFSKRALANPRFQRDEAQRCFALVYLRDYVKEHHVVPHEGLRDMVLHETYKTLGVETTADVAKKIDVSEEKLESIIQDAMLPRMVERHLLETMPENELLDLFKVDARRYSFKLIDFPNTPTSSEVQEHLAKHEKEIIAYLRSNPRMMSQPPQAHFIRIAFPKDGGEEDIASFKNAEALRKLAIQEGSSAAIESCQKQASVCKVVNDADNTHVEPRNDDNAWAFRSPVGSVSEVLTRPVSNEVWILTEIDPPQPYDLTVPSVRHLLTEKVMIETTPAPHILDTIKPLIEAPVPDLKAIAEQNGGRYRSFDDVTYAYIVSEKLVESPEVLRVMAEMSDREARLFSNPIVDNGRIYVFYVSNLTPASTDDFAKVKARWIDLVANDPAAHNANKWIADQTPSLTTMNIKPIEFEYGILQPNGSIR